MRAYKLYQEYVDYCLATRVPSNKMLMFKEWVKQTSLLGSKDFFDEQFEFEGEGFEDSTAH